MPNKTDLGVCKMDERRRSKRSDLSGTIIIKRLDKQEQETNIEIVDLSKTGLGFLSPHQLNVGAVYECFLTIWTKEVIHAFLEIQRIERISEQQFNYGAVFIGMPETEASRIQVYQTFEENGIR